MGPYESSFRTFDANDYSPLGKEIFLFYIFIWFLFSITNIPCMFIQGWNMDFYVYSKPEIMIFLIAGKSGRVFRLKLSLIVLIF